MAFNRVSGRQEPSAAYIKLTLGTGGDVAAQGKYALMQLPQKAVVTRVSVNVLDATTTSTTFSVGDSANYSRYASAVAGDAVAMTTSHGTGRKTTTVEDLWLTVAGATPAAFGILEIYVEYLVDGRVEYSVGSDAQTYTP